MFKHNIYGDQSEVPNGMPYSFDPLSPKFFVNPKCPPNPIAIEATEAEANPSEATKEPEGSACHTPDPRLRRAKGAQDYTGTLYLLFQTLVGPSLITESKYHIQSYKSKTTTVVVFIVSIHTVLNPIYIYI